MPSINSVLIHLDALSNYHHHIINEAFDHGEVPTHAKNKMKALMETVIGLLQETIGGIEFWQNPDKQKQLRSQIKTALTLTNIPELKQNRERVTVEIMKLAKNRHDELWLRT